MYSNDILFYREINPPPPLQIELLPAIADTENEVQIPYHDISSLKIRHPANHAQSCFRFYSWNAENGRQREFLMRVDKCTMSKEQRSRARGHNYNPGQV